MPIFNIRRLLTAVLIVPITIIDDVLAIPYTAAGFPGKIVKKSEDLLSAYDYVVVGGGTSGLVVSSRLSENPKGRMCSLRYIDVPKSV